MKNSLGNAWESLHAAEGAAVHTLAIRGGGVRVTPRHIGVFRAVRRASSHLSSAAAAAVSSLEPESERDSENEEDVSCNDMSTPAFSALFAQNGGEDALRDLRARCEAVAAEEYQREKGRERSWAHTAALRAALARAACAPPASTRCAEARAARDVIGMSTSTLWCCDVVKLIAVHAACGVAKVQKGLVKGERRYSINSRLKRVEEPAAHTVGVIRRIAKLAKDMEVDDMDGEGAMGEVQVVAEEAAQKVLEALALAAGVLTIMRRP